MFCGCCTADESKEVILGIKTETPGSGTDSYPPPLTKVESRDEPKLAEKPSTAAVEVTPSPPATASPVTPTPAPTPASVQQEAPKATPKEETPAPAPAAPAAPAPAPAAAPSVPAPQVRSWSAVVSKSGGQSLGLDVDYADTVTLKVVKVKEGIVQDWNMKNADNVIKPHDKIVSVNGVSGSTTKILEKVKEQGQLTLIIERPSEFEITIVKDTADQSIGLDVDANIVKVLKIKDGPVANYNAKLAFDQQAFAIKPDDKIVKANGADAPADVVKVLVKNQTLNIRVRREA